MSESPTTKQKLQAQIRELKTALREALLVISVRTKQMDEDGYKIHRLERENAELREALARLNLTK